MIVTIYWRDLDDLLLHYVSSTDDIQAARDYCMRKSSKTPERIYCLYRAQNAGEYIMSQYENGQAFVQDRMER